MKGNPPLSNSFFIASILGLMLTVYVWQLSSQWGFWLLVMCLIMFVASFISAIRAPLDSDDEIELAVHERYKNRKYPATDIDESQVKPVSTAYFKAKLSPKQALANTPSLPKNKAIKKKPAKKKAVKKVVKKK
jgi:uncharacterized protein (DUF58 family)